MIERARSVGGGDQGVALTDEACAFLVATLAHDLSVPASEVHIPPDLPDFFAKVHPETLVLKHRDFLKDLGVILDRIKDADSYFACLAKLHKSRLKYQRILERQPLPTMDQVGPRGLLQYGHLSPPSLAGLLFWRKWFFDIDNRAGQETGYLFEPIIALSIGGVPVSAKKSPVHRHADRTKGRQVDCIKGKLAYEFKIRVTIAASGQGRWAEELSFPRDATHSGYQPILVVFDPTSNRKLDELVKVFQDEGGETYVGEGAWAHLEKQAGRTMARFLEKYVRAPLADLLKSAGADLPRLQAELTGERLSIRIGDDTLSVNREPGPLDDSGDALPDDVDEEVGGP